jgi:HK97 family phage prohead protease
MKIYLPIAKVDAAQRMVYGYASTEAKDDQGEVVKREALDGALGDYMKFANIREMHQLSAVGKAKEAEVDDKGLYIAAKIVDDQAWNKVVERVYQGFSIGGKVTAREPADYKTITGLRLDEISLVDRPANPEAVFDCWKRSGSESRKDIVDDPIASLKASIERVEALVKAKDEPAPAKAGGEGDNPRIKSGDYGDVKYADPGYQSDGKKRYPIDTEKHIRAAWNYINKPKNAGKYSADEVKHIKAKIVAAWKDKIDPEGPPSADDGEKAARVELKKHLMDVGSVAEILLRLDWLKDMLITEAAMEGDDSPQPARLGGIIDELCGFLNALVAEETAELRSGEGPGEGRDDEMMDGPGSGPGQAMAMAAVAASLRKSGLGGRAELVHRLTKAKHSMGDQALLDLAHGACKAARGIDGLTTDERGHLDDCVMCMKAAGARESCGVDSTQETARNPTHPAPQVEPPAQEYRPGEYTTVNTAEHQKRVLELIAQSLGKRGKAHQALIDVAHGCLNKLTDGKTCIKEAAGGRHSKETMEHLCKAHDHLCAAGAKCDAVSNHDAPMPGGKPGDGEEEDQGTEYDYPGAADDLRDARRPGGLQKRYDALAQAVAELAPRLDQIAADVAAIKRTPLPPLTARSTLGLARIEKGHDGAAPGEISDAELTARIARMSPDEQAMLLIKAARRNPIPSRGPAPIMPPQAAAEG